ncbi:MAG TPA: alpha-galactosidase, partial [Rectinemataceae bacterium]|nr:alpha-galactosidase [Rectinemataceae bacterium]
AGWNPGWGGTFHCLDLSLSEVERHLLSIFDTLIEEWGYRYLKLDFLYAGLLRGRHAGGGAAYQHYDRVMGRIGSRTRNSGGKPVAYLGCGAALEASSRHFPLMRIGADTRERWEYGVLRLLGYPGRPAAHVNLGHSIARSLFNGTIFRNDPDVLFCRATRIGLSETEKELVALVAFMFGSQIMVSDSATGAREGLQRAFTRRMLALHDRLAGGHYGAERLARDRYRVFSEDRSVEGLINLSDRHWRGPSFGHKRPIVSHMRAHGSVARYAPHSISLFED